MLKYRQYPIFKIWILTAAQSDNDGSELHKNKGLPLIQARKRFQLK